MITTLFLCEGKCLFQVLLLLEGRLRRWITVTQTLEDNHCYK